jgi:hypothetical protein
MPETVRIEIKIDKETKDHIVQGLLPIHGVQKYAILAAMRNFATLPPSKRQELVNEEIRLEKGRAAS